MGLLSRLFRRSASSDPVDISAIEDTAPDPHAAVDSVQEKDRVTSDDVGWRLIILTRFVGLALIASEAETASTALAAAAHNGFDAPEIQCRLTGAERSLLLAGPENWSEEQRTRLLWGLEAACTLWWALGRTSDLPEFYLQGDAKSLLALSGSEPELFVAGACLRARAELNAAYHCAQFWFWRGCVYEQERAGETPDPSTGFSSYADLVRARTELAERRGDLIHSMDGDVACNGKPFGSLSESEWLRVLSITEQRFQALRWVYGAIPENDWDSYPKKVELAG